MKNSIVIRNVAQLILFLALLGIVVYSIFIYDDNFSVLSDFDIDDIELNIIEENYMPNGINYSVELNNRSEYVIVQNNVYISYPIKSANSNVRRQNSFKVEAKGNMLNIKPNESIVLTAFMPKEVYEDNEFILQRNPEFEFVGYLIEVNENTRFMKAGDIKLRNSD